MNEFYPKDTDKIIYIDSSGGIDLDYILKIVKEKWPNSDVTNLIIYAEKIHTRCLGYDLHDEDDWDNFIVIENNELS